MTNLSTSPISMVLECLANAMEAAQRLDAAASEELRAMLRIASSEAGRLAKAKRATPAKAAKPAAKAKKSPAKAIVASEVKAAPKQPRSRRKAITVNGVAGH
jgi:hypothetical protein